jgi:voltage-gated potassium channel
MTSRDHLPEDDQALASERTELLERVAGWLDVPMIVLGFVWLVLLGIELLWEQVWQRHAFLESLSTGIWIAFIVNFAVELILAPRKRD